MSVPTREIAAWRHHTIGASTIDTVGLPIAESTLDSSFPAAVQEYDNASDETATSDTLPPITSLGPKHGRSYELAPGPLAVLSVFGDQYGNRYTSMSLKGNNFTTPQITESATAPSGFMPFGLQEGDSLERVLRASTIMREAGIATEWIVRVLEPKAIDYQGLLLSARDYKKQIIADTLQEEGLEEGAEKASAIKDMSFFVTARATNINDRIWDLDTRSRSNNPFDRTKKIFTVYNTLNAAGHSDVEPLDPALAEDRAEYFTKILPSLCGATLGKLHNIGLYHGYAHLGNYTVLGGLVDADSVKGPSLGFGDPEISDDDKARDLREFISGAGSYRFLLIKLGMKEADGELFFKKDRQATLDAENIFLEAYCSASGIDLTKPYFLQTALQVLSSKKQPLYSNGVLEKYVSKTLFDEELQGHIADLARTITFDTEQLLAEAETSYYARLDKYLNDCEQKGEAVSEDLYAVLVEGCADEIRDRLREEVFVKYLENTPDSENTMFRYPVPEHLQKTAIEAITATLASSYISIPMTQLQAAAETWQKYSKKETQPDTIPEGLAPDIITFFKGAPVHGYQGIDIEGLLSSISQLHEDVTILCAPYEGTIPNEVYDHEPAQYFTDAAESEFYPDHSLDYYFLEYQTSEDGSYVAFLSRPDEAGKRHLVIRPFDYTT